MSVRASAFILAAGLGTRISSLSRHRPKPLLPVGDTTPFAHAAAQLHAAGITRIVANASHLAAQLRVAGVAAGVEIVDEIDGPLGTAGGLAACTDRLGFSDHPTTRPDAIVVWNGDIFADFDAARLLHPLAEDDACCAVLAVSDEQAPGFGNVGLGADGRVVRLRSESFAPAGSERASASFSALHAMRVDLARSAPTRGCLIADVYLPALARGASIRTIAFETCPPAAPRARWYDIGDADSYLRANLSTLGGRAATLGVSARVSAAVTLERAVIGGGAIVDGEGVLRDVVVWPGARVSAPCERAIVVDGETIVRL